MDKKEEKFLSLIEIHKRIIYKVANGYCKEVDEREDLIQEIIIQLWLSLDNYSDQYKLSTWVYRIALNTSISHYRKNKTRKARTTILSPVIKLKNDDYQSRFESEDFQLLNKLIQELKEIDKGISFYTRYSFSLNTFTNHVDYDKSEINTPAATAEPITPEILLDIAYCKI